MGRLHDGVEEYTLDYSAQGKTETGIASQNRRQICIQDGLKGVAVLVDGKSKGVIASVDIARQAILATRIGDTDNLKKFREFHGNSGQAIWGTDISPDGKRVATCTNAGDWQIWDSKTGAELTKIKASSFPMRSVAFTSDGMKLLTAGDDEILSICPELDIDPTMRIPLPSINRKNDH